MSLQLPMIVVLQAEISRAPRTWGELRAATGADPEQLDLLLSRMERRGEAIRTPLGWAVRVPEKPFVLKVRAKSKGDGKRRCPRCYIRRDIESFDGDHTTCRTCRTKARAAYYRAKAKRVIP